MTMGCLPGGRPSPSVAQRKSERFLGDRSQVRILSEGRGRMYR